MRTVSKCAIGLVLLAGLAGHARAQWVLNGNPVSTATGTQALVRAVSGGAGGVAGETQTRKMVIQR